MSDMFDIFSLFKDEEHVLNQNNTTKIIDKHTVNSNINTSPSSNYCIHCNINSLVYEDGNYYCSCCGIFQNKTLSEDIEYRYYGDSDNKSTNPERLGMPTNILLPESSLGSLISTNSSISFKKMIQYNIWNSMPYKERSQLKVFTEIASKSKSHGIPNMIIEQAKAYYKIISEKSIHRGSNRNGLIAACIYMACKKEKVPRSTKEIAAIFNIDIQDMTKGCKKFKEIFRLNNIEITKNNSSNPLDYIERFCSNLQILDDVKYVCEFVAVKSISSNHNIVMDNTSPSIAAGTIFLVINLLNYPITKKNVAIACKISEVTISKCFKKLNNHKLELLPKKFIETHNIQ